MFGPYLTWLILFVILPTAIMWLFAHDMLWRYRRVFVFCIVGSLIFGLAWDAFAVLTKIWFWPEECCILPRIWKIPFEEVLFIVFVASYVVTLTLVLRAVIKHHQAGKRRA